MASLVDDDRALRYRLGSADENATGPCQRPSRRLCHEVGVERERVRLSLSAPEPSAAAE